jgi:hypothetical protein
MSSTGEQGGRYGTFLDLPAGQWWAPDGRLRMTVVRVSDQEDSGWVWVEGWCHDVGSEETEWARVPVRVDALARAATESRVSAKVPATEPAD